MQAFAKPSRADHLKIVQDHADKIASDWPRRSQYLQPPFPCGRNCWFEEIDYGVHVDRSTVLGILVALTGLGAGLVLEGGKLIQVLQPTAALIVFGGTLGAVMIQFPLPVVLQAAAQLR